mmetsp:Transcript_960/g.1451  ORF Transcript_960/g.1451 Transcript_960/m.1451 type:complete len:109 (+) Transcript_960:454-780(+)
MIGVLAAGVGAGFDAASRTGTALMAVGFWEVLDVKRFARLSLSTGLDTALAIVGEPIAGTATAVAITGTAAVSATGDATTGAAFIQGISGGVEAMVMLVAVLGAGAVA